MIDQEFIKISWKRYVEIINNPWIIFANGVVFGVVAASFIGTLT